MMNSLNFKHSLTIGLLESRFFSLLGLSRYFGFPWASAIFSEIATIIRAVRVNIHSADHMPGAGPAPYIVITPISPPTTLCVAGGLLSPPCYECRKWGRWAMVIELINGLCVEITPHRGEAHWWGWRNPGTRQRTQGSRALDAQTQGGENWQRCFGSCLCLERKWHRWVLPSESPGLVREVEGTQGRKEAEEREVWKLGRGTSLAAASHEEPLSSWALCPQGANPRGGWSKLKVCLPSASFFCFDKWVLWPGWKNLSGCSYDCFWNWFLKRLCVTC